MWFRPQPIIPIAVDNSCEKPVQNGLHPITLLSLCMCTLELGIIEYIIIASYFFAAIIIYIFFAVSLIFNGTNITGPILIYHDEIGSDTTIPTDENSDDPGDLVCRSASIGRTFWHIPTGDSIPGTTSGDIYNVQTPTSDPQMHPFLARLSTIDSLNSTDSAINGLWFCALGFTGNIEVQDVIDSFIYVGIYSRNSGELY